MTRKRRIMEGQNQVWEWLRRCWPDPKDDGAPGCEGCPYGQTDEDGELTCVGGPKAQVPVSALDDLRALLEDLNEEAEYRERERRR